MKKQTVKRVNVNLTQYELKALEKLAKKFPEENMSDIIRDAIEEYANKYTDFQALPL